MAIYKDDGWMLRSDIIWHKPNAMPSSVKNRPTTDHEYIFLFVKNKDDSTEKSSSTRPRVRKIGPRTGLRAPFFSGDKDYYYDIDAIREPHVTFTPKSRMKGGRGHFGKKNGTPEQGKNSGNANLHSGRWDQAFHPKGRNRRTVWEIPLSKFREAHFAVFPDRLVELCILAGCPKDGIVLDPFIGSGTTAVIAQRLGRKYVGVDINLEYCKMARKRL